MKKRKTVVVETQNELLLAIADTVEKTTNAIVQARFGCASIVRKGGDDTFSDAVRNALFEMLNDIQSIDAERVP
jgi:hypothetical protein